jgi:hydrogenase/urease accessory protein HupE
MKLAMTAALVLSLAVSLTPLAAMAHEGHDHGVKAKKVKKPKAKKAAVEFVMPQRVG